MKKLIALLAGLLGAPASAQTGLGETLDVLDAVLHDVRPAFARTLVPPLSATQIDALATKYDVVIPESLRIVYLWHNGQDPQSFDSFIENSQLLSLDQLLSTRAELNGMIGYDFTLENWWHPDWFPLLHNGGGDYIVYDASGVHTGQKGQMLQVYHDWDHRPVIAFSLESLMAAALAYHRDTPAAQMDEPFGLEDFLPETNLSFKASGDAVPLDGG